MFCFFYSVCSGRKVSGSAGVSLAITGGALFFLHLLFEARSMSIHQNQYDTCPSMVFVSYLRFYRLKPRHRWTSMLGAWPALSRDLFFGQLRVWAMLYLLGHYQRFLAAACYGGYPFNGELDRNIWCEIQKKFLWCETKAWRRGSYIAQYEIISHQLYRDIDEVESTLTKLIGQIPYNY
jgi:hypothetical protein